MEKSCHTVSDDWSANDPNQAAILKRSLSTTAIGFQLISQSSIAIVPKGAVYGHVNLSVQKVITSNFSLSNIRKNTHPLIVRPFLRDPRGIPTDLSILSKICKSIWSCKGLYKNTCEPLVQPTSSQSSLHGNPATQRSRLLGTGTCISACRPQSTLQSHEGKRCIPTFFSLLKRKPSKRQIHKQQPVFSPA